MKIPIQRTWFASLTIDWNVGFGKLEKWGVGGMGYWGGGIMGEWGKCRFAWYTYILATMPLIFRRCDFSLLPGIYIIFASFAFVPIHFNFTQTPSHRRLSSGIRSQISYHCKSSPIQQKAKFNKSAG